MKKFLKKLAMFWKTNRVMCVLATILIICLIVVCYITTTFFFGGSSSSYGDRLEGLDKHAISNETLESIQNKVKEDGTVANVTTRCQGKILYIKVTYNNDGNIDNAKGKMNEIVLGLEENITNYYDVHVTISKDSSEEVTGFLLMGAKNINQQSLVWQSINS